MGEQVGNNERGGQRDRIIGLICVVLSAACFALAGVFIKLIPWSAFSISAARCALGAVVVYGYLRLRGGRLVLNRPTLIAGATNLVVIQTFMVANKLTTAANTIVLQFTEPAWVILLAWLIFRNKPRASTFVAVACIFAGIVCFFADQISPQGALGSVLALVSGFAYAGVFMFKKFEGCDFESAVIYSFIGCVIMGAPALVGETDFSPRVLLYVAVLGIVQIGLAYVLLSRGLDSVSPVTASLTSTLEPVLNPILATIVLGETLGPLSLLGAVLVIGSATVYNVMSLRREES